MSTEFEVKIPGPLPGQDATLYPDMVAGTPQSAVVEPDQSVDQTADQAQPADASDFVEPVAGTPQSPVAPGQILDDVHEQALEQGQALPPADDVDLDGAERAAFHDTHMGPGTLPFRDASLLLPHERIRGQRVSASEIYQQTLSDAATDEEPA